jgi:type III secretory pathway component EscU
MLAHIIANRIKLDEVKGISLLSYLLMVRMELKLIEQCQEPLLLIDNFNYKPVNQSISQSCDEFANLLNVQCFTFRRIYGVNMG